jgi:opacity protein-like surface antigen
MAILLGAPAAEAQHKAEITPFVGYLWNGSVQTVRGDVGVKSDIAYGAILDVNVRSGGQFEFSYTRQDTKLQIRELSGIRRDLTDIAVNSFQIGGLGYTQKGPAQPFVSLTLGANWYAPKDGTITDGQGGTIAIKDEWRFSFALGLGVKYFAAERVALRLQGRLGGVFLDTGGGVFCGFGGCSLGLFGAGEVFGDVSAGLAIAVG